MTKMVATVKQTFTTSRTVYIYYITYSVHLLHHVQCTFTTSRTVYICISIVLQYLKHCSTQLSLIVLLLLLLCKAHTVYAYLLGRGSLDPGPLAGLVSWRGGARLGPQSSGLDGKCRHLPSPLWSRRNQK